MDQSYLRVGLCHAPKQLRLFMPVSVPMCLPQLFAEDFCFVAEAVGRATCPLAGMMDATVVSVGLIPVKAPYRCATRSA